MLTDLSNVTICPCSAKVTFLLEHFCLFPVDKIEPVLLDLFLARCCLGEPSTVLQFRSFKERSFETEKRGSQGGK